MGNILMQVVGYITKVNPHGVELKPLEVIHDIRNENAKAYHPKHNIFIETDAVYEKGTLITYLVESKGVMTIDGILYTTPLFGEDGKPVHEIIEVEEISREDFDKRYKQ